MTPEINAVRRLGLSTPMTTPAACHRNEIYGGRSATVAKVQPSVQKQPYRHPLRHSPDKYVISDDDDFANLSASPDLPTIPPLKKRMRTLYNVNTLHEF